MMRSPRIFLVLPVIIFLAAMSTADTWSALPPGTGFSLLDMVQTADLPGGHVSDIAFAPGNPNVLYLASNVNAMGVWRSDDGGETWQRLFYDANFSATHTNSIAVHPADSGTAIVGDLHGHITRSTDGGAQWQRVYTGSRPVYDVAFSPSQPAIVYAGDGGGSLLKSIDAGNTWNVMSVVQSNGIGSLAVDPQYPGTLYAGARDGVFKSTDGGQGWAKVLNSAQIVEVTVAPSEPNLVLAAASDGVYRSDDNGSTWTRTLNSHAHSVKVAAADSQVVHAGTAEGVYRSADGGLSWANQSSGLQYTDVGPLTVHPQDPNAVLAGSNIWQWTFHRDPFPASTEGEGIYKTTDGGGSWSKKTGGFIDRDVVAVAVDPNNPDVVYVGPECSRGIFRSQDGGASWAFISGGPENGFWDIGHYTMLLEVDAGSNVYLTGRFGFARSADQGQSWTPLPNSSVRRHSHGLGISPHDSQLIFVGTSPKQDPTETDDFPGGRILRSTDGGGLWQEVGSGFPSGADTSVHDFAFDAVDPNVVYVATTKHEIGLPPTSVTVGIYKSTDGGDTWTEANSGLTTLDVDSIAASPTTSGLLFAATEHGVFGRTMAALAGRPPA